MIWLETNEAKTFFEDACSSDVVADAVSLVVVGNAVDPSGAIAVSRLGTLTVAGVGTLGSFGSARSEEKLGLMSSNGPVE